MKEAVQMQVTGQSDSITTLTMAQIPPASRKLSKMESLSTFNPLSASTEMAVKLV
jgi:hypothetical protein